MAKYYAELKTVKIAYYKKSYYRLVVIYVLAFFCYLCSVSMAMKLNEKRVGHPTRKMTEVWVTKLVRYHQKVDLSSGFIKELEAGLEVGQLLQLSTPFAFGSQNLIDFMAVREDRMLRPLAQIM